MYQFFNDLGSFPIIASRLARALLLAGYALLYTRWRFAMKKSLLVFALVALVLMLPVGAFADSITFDPSANSGSLSVVNINFPSPVSGGALTITGTTVGNPSYNVYFDSTELLNTSGSGQADLVAQDGKLNFVNIHLDATYTYLELYANPD